VKGSELPQEIQARVNEWLTGSYDQETKNEIRALLKNNPAALCDAFSSDLSFGTAGMRGLMGVGTSRLNLYTIRIATEGLARYLVKHTKSPSVFIGFDSRHHSEAFAQEAARVLAAHGIHVFLLKHLRPTPFVSFGVRAKKCTAGIMITASHNPKEYNGYKVYWSDGAQVVPPHDTGIMDEVHRIKGIEGIKLASLSDPHITHLNEQLDGDYLAAIRPLQHFPQDNQTEGSSLKIVYTGLHGTGVTLTPSALSDWGFTSVHFVDEQIQPNGDFPTVKFPNPEYPEAAKLGTQHLVNTHSDILIINDPDADRTGVVAMHHGNPVPLNGNEIAAICANFICRNTPQKKGAIITTIVTTELLKSIAKVCNVAYFEVLTGFKYIGEKIHLWETTGFPYQFLFGAEESYGYLIGTHARDKDAPVASCLISEIALQAKLQGKTLIDLLFDIYRTYGIFREKQLSIGFPPGEEGMKKMSALMNQLRAHPLKTLCDQPVVLFEDYAHGLHDLPPSDVLLLRLKDNSKIIIRPSGTEPKIKIYASVSMKAPPDIDQGIAQCDAKLETLLSTLKKELTQ
jgi:phosphomannomutase